MDTQERINSIESRINNATPAPWYVNYLDDSRFMNLVAITTIPDSGNHETVFGGDGDEIRGSIIATTLLQAEVGDGKPFVEVSLHDDNNIDSDGYPNYSHWQEDAEFIAHAREDIPWLLKQIEDLERRIEELLLP